MPDGPRGRARREAYVYMDMASCTPPVQLPDKAIDPGFPGSVRATRTNSSLDADTDGQAHTATRRFEFILIFILIFIPLLQLAWTVLLNRGTRVRTLFDITGPLTDDGLILPSS